MFLLGFPGSEVAGFQGEQASRNVEVLKRERARWSLQVNGMDFQPSGYSAVASSAGSSLNAAPGVLSHPQAHGRFVEGGLHAVGSSSSCGSSVLVLFPYAMGCTLSLKDPCPGYSLWR